MATLYILTVTALLLSFMLNREKTKKALKIAWKKFNKILGTYLKLLIILSFILLISDEMIIRYLGGHTPIVGLLIGLVAGSITMMPGFIAYPLAGILVDKGVSYIVFLIFIIFLGISYILKFNLGLKIGDNFLIFARDMAKILPPAFVLIPFFIKGQTIILSSPM